jgi:predicted anti-sigma-YlaC factor YlaD
MTAQLRISEYIQFLSTRGQTSKQSSVEIGDLVGAGVSADQVSLWTSSWLGTTHFALTNRALGEETPSARQSRTSMSQFFQMYRSIYKLT